MRYLQNHYRSFFVIFFLTALFIILQVGWGRKQQLCSSRKCHYNSRQSDRIDACKRRSNYYLHSITAKSTSSYDRFGWLEIQNRSYPLDLTNLKELR